MCHITQNLSIWLDEWRANLFYYSRWCIGCGECAWSFSESLTRTNIYKRICLQCMPCWVPKNAVFDGAQKRFFGAVVDILNENPISCNLSREITLQHPQHNPPLFRSVCAAAFLFLSAAIQHTLRLCVIGWLLKCDLWDAWAAIYLLLKNCEYALISACALRSTFRKKFIEI